MCTISAPPGVARSSVCRFSETGLAPFSGGQFDGNKKDSRQLSASEDCKGPETSSVAQIAFKQQPPSFLCQRKIFSGYATKTAGLARKEANELNEGLFGTPAPRYADLVLLLEVGMGLALLGGAALAR